MTRFLITRRAGRAVTALLAAAFIGGSPVAAETVLRVVPIADLKNTDPHWTTAGITQNHGYMVYDTPFATDTDLEPQPQMVASHTVSNDGMTYRFSLRPGMVFHDGSPVEARDVVASIKRWAARNAGGKALMERVARFEATEDLTFELHLARKFGQVIRVLANPTLPPFVMREEEAATDPFTQVTDVIGSGPFVFDKDAWRPGDKVVYRKFAAYKPRPEAADGFAGGKVVNVDVVEWIYIADLNTAAQALIAGEVDILAAPSYDILSLLKRDPNVAVDVLDRIGWMGHLRPNHLFPPFDNPKARQALQLLIDQNQYLAAMVGNPDFQRECHSIYMCGTLLETDAHAEPWRRPDIEKAKQLFAEAGYSGEEVVIMQPTDFPISSAIALLTAQALRDVGVKVRIDAMDWSTLTSRRTSKEPPGRGSPGWNLFGTAWTHVQFGSPLTNIPLVSTCDRKNWFGWPCDEKTEALRTRFIEALAPDEQQRLAQQIQERYFETFPYYNTGQYLQPIAWRTNITNVPRALTLQVWGLEKR